MGKMFDDIMDSLKEVKAHKEGKTLLKGKQIEVKPVRKMTPSQIKSLRKKLNMTQVFFAQIIGVSPRTVEAWESGKRIPSDIAFRFMHVIKEHKNILNDIINVKKAS